MPSTGWNDPGETIIAGNGQVYVAAVGSTAPTSEASALAPATWFGLGYHTEDGVSISESPEIVRHRAWQTRTDVRRTRDSDTFQVTFALEQWNEQSVPLAFGGGTVSEPTSNKFKFVPPTAGAAENEKALVCDVIDGSTTLRFYIPRGTVVDGVTSQFTRSQLGVLPITFEAMEPDDGTPAWSLFTNSTGFTAGS